MSKLHPLYIRAAMEIASKEGANPYDRYAAIMAAYARFTRPAVPIVESLPECLRRRQAD